MKRISFKIFLFLNCLTYGFIALYVLINYLFLENYQISLKKKEILSIAQKYNVENHDELKEYSEENGIFIREFTFEKDKKNPRVHPTKFLEKSLIDKLKINDEELKIEVGKDNIQRIILLKKLSHDKVLYIGSSIAPITEVIKSTLKFFIYVVLLSIPINLYIAYFLSIRMGKPIESELLELNRQLKEELEKEKKSEQFRKNFISNVTHELKTPVAIIGGYTEAIIDGIIDDDEIPEICENINEEASNMNALIQELLFYCKMESGYIHVANDQINVKDSIESILKRYNMDFRLNNINLNTNLENIYLKTDKKLFERCLNNLIINALAYVDNRKEIKITLNENEIIIENSGKQLTEENIENYFKPFFNKNDKKIKKYGGTGLGLSIVAEILRGLSFKYNFYYDSNIKAVIFKILLQGETNEKTFINTSSTK